MLVNYNTYARIFKQFSGNNTFNINIFENVNEAFKELNIPEHSVYKYV